MTINVDNQAVLIVLGRKAPAHHFETSDEDAFQDVRQRKPDDDQGGLTGPLVQVGSSDCCREFNDNCVDNVLIPTEISSDEDDYSISSNSSSSSCDSEVRRVSFAEDLVTGVRTRPRTPPEDLPALFYTGEETQRFRQEYRLERQLLAQLESHDDPNSTPTLTLDEEDLTFLDDDSARNQHQISRVVVMHNNTLETYHNEPLSSTEDDVDSFFDNDSFWSGSITWY